MGPNQRNPEPERSAWAPDAEHTEKAFHFGGKPAAGGVGAAMLIRSGWTGVDEVFTGFDNFFEAYAPRGNGLVKADPSQLVNGLGERYEITRANIKKWTVGAPIQAPPDALAGFFLKRSFSADEVQKVVVCIASDEANTVSNREMPDICMQHMIAVMLLDKTVTFASADDQPHARSHRFAPACQSRGGLPIRVWTPGARAVKPSSNLRLPMARGSLSGFATSVAPRKTP